MARKKIEEIEGEIIEGEEVIRKWSTLRIVLGILMALFLGYAVYIFLHDISIKVHQKAVQVLDQSTQVSKQPIPEEVRLPSQKDVDYILRNVKQTVFHLSSENLMSSANSLQKVIGELQQLQSGKQSPIQLLCDIACK